MATEELTKKWWNENQSHPKVKAWTEARNEALDLPSVVKNVLYALAKDQDQPIELKLVEDKTIIRSVDVTDEVEFNLRIHKQLKEEGIDLEDAKTNVYWCDSCDDHDFYWCEYRQYGDHLSCPEYTVDVQVKTDVAEAKQEKTKMWKPWDLSSGDAADSYVGSEVWPKPDTPATGFKPASGLHKAGSGVTPLAKTQIKPVSAVSAQPANKIPFGTFFRCMFCWHWFENEEKLAGHVIWACPGREGNTPESQHMVLKCCCDGCHTLEDRLVSRKPKEVEDTPSSTVATVEVSDTVAVPDGDGKEDQTT